MQAKITVFPIFFLLIMSSNQILFPPRLSRSERERNKCDETQTRVISQQRNCLETVIHPAEQIIESLRAGNVEPALEIARQYFLKCNSNELDFDQECCAM